MTELENGTRRAVDIVIARLELQTAQTLQTVNEIKLWLMGDGTAANPGVMIRLDRLEQIEKAKEESESKIKTWRLGLSASIILLFLERAWHFASLYLGTH